MAEWSKAPVLKTGDVKASVGSNPTLSAKKIQTVGYTQKYPSGRRGSPAKGVGCVKSAARVQIPPSAPTKERYHSVSLFCFREGFEVGLQKRKPKAQSFWEQQSGGLLRPDVENPSKIFMYYKNYYGENFLSNIVKKLSTKVGNCGMIE